MPLLFFHLRTPEGLDVGDIGTPFPDLDAAYLDVCRAIPAMLKGLLRDGHDPLRCAFEIVDEHGRQVMEVPFAERLMKAVVRPRSRARTPAPGTAVLHDRVAHTITLGQAESDYLCRLIREARSMLARSASLRDASSTTWIAQHYGLPTLRDGAG